MNREDIVMVKSSDGGPISFSAGQKYSLKLAAGEVTDKWMDGSPITRGEFEILLAPHGPFEIAGEISGEAQFYEPAAVSDTVRFNAGQEE